jgi:hypothetical protein
MAFLGPVRYGDSVQLSLSHDDVLASRLLMDFDNYDPTRLQLQRHGNSEHSTHVVGRAVRFRIPPSREHVPVQVPQCGIWQIACRNGDRVGELVGHMDEIVLEQAFTYLGADKQIGAVLLSSAPAFENMALLRPSGTARSTTIYLLLLTAEYVSVPDATSISDVGHNRRS